MYQFAMISSDFSDFLIVVLAAVSSMLAVMSIALSPLIIFTVVSSSQGSLFASSSSFVPSIVRVASTFLAVFLAAVPSLLAMMSIAFSPWIIFTTVSSNKYSFCASSSSVPSTIRVVSISSTTATNTTTGEEIRSSLNEQRNKTDVDYANQTDHGHERKIMKTRSCSERSIHQVPLPANGIYNEEERTLIFPTSNTALSTAIARSSSPTPTATSTGKSPTIVTPKRLGLATNVVFRGATLSVETCRPLKRKISDDNAESDDGIVNSNGSSSDINELQPKKKSKSSTPNNKKSNNNKMSTSNKKKRLSGRRFRRMEEERIRRKKKQSTTNNWMTMYEKLATFKEQNNGSIVIPWNSGDSDLQQLGYWIRDQKRKLRTKKISRNRADLLRSIGIA
mmetsp:Transcript_13575/g.28462  ORF Transcript_13575/g.28462 Transcript_13575/m.28462 type:complete len:393 (-) Transcript_13575:453-1631(-)